MTLLVITGRGGDTAPDTANSDIERARALARRVDDLVVLEADETWWSPTGARGVTVSSKPVGSDPADARRSSLGIVLADAAQREPGAIVLLLDADIDRVKRIHPLTQRLDVPLLWWHEEPPSPRLVAEVGQSVAGLITTWTNHAAVPAWLWSAGAGIDVEALPLIETMPDRPPLQLLAWEPSGEPELSTLLQALAYARGLAVDVHLTIALVESGATGGQRRQIDARIRDLALSRSARVVIVDGRSSLQRMLTEAHALVDVEGPDGVPPLEVLLAMAHARPVLSSREQLATLLDAAPLALKFAPGDAQQLADGMKSLAAAWSDELVSVGQTLRDAVRQEHSVTHWAEAVASIVGFVRTQRRIASEPAGASERAGNTPQVTAKSSSPPANNSSSPPAKSTAAHETDLDAPEDSPENPEAEPPKNNDAEDDSSAGAPGRRRRRFRRSAGP
jgi:hypothetical protein